ncbi:MAG TPA: peptidoglycan editing factor PgeF [Desulfomonilia bacterium]|nr:peptidoglycan editing factor PgeF [Desulfomonilia bacterium]
MTEDLDGSPEQVSQMLRGLFPDSRIICLKQIHSDMIVRAEDVTPGSFPEADGAVSHDPSFILCIRTADCVPVLLWADDSPLIAAIHAGWRGLALDIVRKAVDLVRAGGARQIHVSMGPSIGPCCYAVGKEVIDALNTEPDRKAAGRIFVDLHRIATLQAQKSGVPSDMIHHVQRCTCCNKDSFFSYRRDGQHAGRNISLIGGESCSLPGLQAR